MELHAPASEASAAIGGHVYFVGGGYYIHAFADGGDGVAVAHPYLCADLDAGHQRIGAVHFAEDGTAVFASGGRFDASAALIGHQLGAVAYAQYRVARHKSLGVNLEGLVIVYREGAAREDDADDIGIVSRHTVVGEDFAVSVEFAQAAAYKLCRLRPEIENNDFLWHRLFCG